MRWFHFMLLLFLLVGIIGGITYAHKDKLVVIKNPPDSLAQWYKPENKRQVWLHNMFKLRREMQAVKLYSNNNDTEHLEAWTTQLNKHYLKIGEMVPEWERKLNKEAIKQLQSSIKDHRYQDVSDILDDLNRSCDSCHNDYRIITAIKYRAPDFSSMEINLETSYTKHMEKLTQQVNSIKIAIKDDMKDIALSSLAELKHDMNVLGKTCTTCHKEDKKDYPSDEIKQTMLDLDKSLNTGTAKEQGKNLGTLAVLACASCHGTHRLSYDMRKISTDRQSWAEIIKH